MTLPMTTPPDGRRTRRTRFLIAATALLGLLVIGLAIGVSCGSDDDQPVPTRTSTVGSSDQPSETTTSTPTENTATPEPTVDPTTAATGTVPAPAPTAPKQAPGQEKKQDKDKPGAGGPPDNPGQPDKGRG